MQNPSPITLLIAHSQPLFLQGLRALMDEATGFKLLAEAQTGPELLEQMSLYHPHLVVTGLDLPGMDGIEACRQIRRLFPGTGVVALGLPGGEKAAYQAIRAGAGACLFPDAVPAELIPALRAVASGRLYGNHLMEEALQELYTGTSRTGPHLPHFTPRELQVISLICRQFTGRQIAAALALSPRSVEEIRSRIQQKIGARSGVGIALYALRHGLVRVS